MSRFSRRFELEAGRVLTQCGLVKSQRQDSVAQNSRVFSLLQSSISTIQIRVNTGIYGAYLISGYQYRVSFRMP